MLPDYRTDRIPLIPVFLDDGDRIFAVHTVGADGKPDVVEEVDLTVTGLALERKAGIPFGRSTVTITFLDADGESGERKFEDPEQWLSVAFPRPISASQQRHSDIVTAA